MDVAESGAFTSPPLILSCFIYPFLPFLLSLSLSFSISLSLSRNTHTHTHIHIHIHTHIHTYSTHTKEEVGRFVSEQNHRSFFLSSLFHLTLHPMELLLCNRHPGVTLLIRVKILLVEEPAVKRDYFQSSICKSKGKYSKWNQKNFNIVMQSVPRCHTTSHTRRIPTVISSGEKGLSLLVQRRDVRVRPKEIVPSLIPNGAGWRVNECVCVFM